MDTIDPQAVSSSIIGRLSPVLDRAQIPQSDFTPLSKLLAETLFEHEELLACLQTQIQEMRCVMTECETAVRRIKKMPIERISAREIVKRENEALSSLWTAESLLCELYSPTHKFLYALKLVGEFRNVFYKHKKFAYLLFRLRFRVVDEQGETVHLQSSLHISISVYHSKAPLRKLTGKRISAGKQLLTGRKIITAAGPSDIVFEDLSFRWITSKMKPRWVVLVVQCSNVPEIRPCVIEGVHVKSPSNYLPQYAAELFGPAVKTQDLCLG